MDQTLILLAREVRNKTLKILNDLTEEESHFKAPGLNNSVLWHAGHSYCVVESLGVSRLKGTEATYPTNWFETFSWKSNPAAVTSWPTLAEVRTKLTEQLNQLVSLLEATPEEKLDTIIDPSRNASLRYAVLHGLHDEAGHQGEMWLLKKMVRKIG